MTPSTAPCAANASPRACSGRTGKGRGPRPSAAPSSLRTRCWTKTTLSKSHWGAIRTVATPSRSSKASGGDCVYVCPVKDTRQGDASGGTQPYRRVDALDWSEAELAQGKVINIKGFPKEPTVRWFRVGVSTHRLNDLRVGIVHRHWLVATARLAHCLADCLHALRHPLEEPLERCFRVVHTERLTDSDGFQVALVHTRTATDSDDVDHFALLTIEDFLSGCLPLVSWLTVSEDEDQRLPVSLFFALDRWFHVSIQRLLKHL